MGVGEQLRIESAVEGFATETLTADADGISKVLADVGQYYLAWRAREDANRWCPVGVIDVLALVDETEQRLRKLIADLDVAIARPEAQHQHVSGADGTGLSRTLYVQLREQRDQAAAQLADYLKKRRGLPPTRMRA